jgi:hypothetical protein
MLPTMNIVVSNVRGPDLPIYLAGAQMVAFAPVSIAMNGLGLNVTGFSYHGTLWVCAVACRQMMPDPAFFAECLREAFGELSGAVREQARPEDAAAQHDSRPSPVRNRRKAANARLRKTQPDAKHRGTKRAGRR